MAVAIPLAFQAIAALATGSAVAAGAMSAAAAAFVVAGAGMLGGYLSSKLSGDENYEALGTQDLRRNTMSGQRTIPIIYGRHRVGGNDLFIGIVEDAVIIVQGLSEGPIEGTESMVVPDSTREVEAIFINGKPIYEWDTTFYVRTQQGTPGLDWTAKYESRTGTKLAREIRYGLPWQGPVDFVTESFPEAGDRYLHTAYVAFKIKAQGISSIPKREIVILGRIVKDVITGVTKYSRNPVDILYDYLTNTRYGLGWSESALDMPSWATCSTYVQALGLYTDYAITTPTKSQYVIDSIMKYFRGSLTWFNGKLSLKYSYLPMEPIAFSVTDEVIVLDGEGHPLVSVSEPDRSSNPSGLRVRYTSVNEEKKQFNLDDFNIGESIGLTAQVDFPAFQDRQSANNMALYTLKRNDNNRTYSATLRADMVQLDVGDVGYLSSTELGLVNTTVRVIQSNFALDGLCAVVFLHEDISIYSDAPISPAETFEELSIFDPKDNPPPVTNVVITEEVYDYRKRSLSRLVVNFDIPKDKTRTPEVDYGWFSHANMYVSFEPFIPDWIDHWEDTTIGAPTFVTSPYEPRLIGPASSAFYNEIEAGDLIYLLGEPDIYQRTKHVMRKGSPNTIVISDWSLGFDDQPFVLIKRDRLKTISGSRDKAMIDPAAETATYYIAPVSVSSSGAVQDYGTETLYQHTVIGVSTKKPLDPFYFLTSPSDGGVNLDLYKDALDTGLDVWGYDYRLGERFNDGIRMVLSSHGSASYMALKPGNHTIWVNSLGTNNLHGENPISTTSQVKKPLSFHEESFYAPLGMTGYTDNMTISGGTLTCTHTNGNTTGLFVADAMDIGTLFIGYSKTAFVDFTWERTIQGTTIPTDPADILVSLSFGNTPAGPFTTVNSAELCYVDGIGRYIQVIILIRDATLDTKIKIENIYLNVYHRISRWETLLR